MIKSLSHLIAHVNENTIYRFLDGGELSSKWLEHMRVGGLSGPRRNHLVHLH